MTPNDVLAFWFEEITTAQWWKVDPAFDAAIAARFGVLHAQAAQSELWAWRATPEGRLAEVIVLDQFSRNRHRGTAQAFACDPLALGLAQEAAAPGHRRSLRALPAPQRGAGPRQHGRRAGLLAGARLALLSGLSRAA